MPRWCPAVRLTYLALIFVWASLTSPIGYAQEAFPVTVGLGGTWKLGHPCPVRVTIPEALLAEVTRIEIDSMDGDGVPITYRQRVASSSLMEAASEHVWLRIQIGRLQTSLKVRLLSDSRLLAERELDPAVESLPLASSQPLIVAIGSSMGVEALSLKSAKNSASTLTTVVLDAADRLPFDLIDYSASDLLLISTRDIELLRAINAQQWSAIDGWIRSGGGCIISLGSTVEELASVPELLSLLPGKVLDQGMVTNPGGLESLVGVTEDPLKPFPVTLLELAEGEVKLMLTDSLARRFPWWIVNSLGQGTIRVVASDMDTTALANWKDRRVLWDRLIEPYFTSSMIDNAAGSEEMLGGATSYLGYNDVVGQLRATLDVFTSVRGVSFGQVAAVLIGILVLVGPIDYFVSVKWLKRPAISWFFAGTLLVAISSGLTWCYFAIRPDAVLVNTAQIVDVDLETGRIDGRLWSHVYSGAARQVDIKITGPRDTGVVLDWQGLPGPGLGGLTSQLITDRGMPAYSIEHSTATGSQILGVGIPSAGTKCLNGRWTSTLAATELGVTSPGALQEMVGVDQLQGVFSNPLSVDLRDAILFYHDWYYVLNSRIAAGEQIVISSEQIPKDLKRRLNRQRSVDGNVRITRWDPAERGELDRLLELMMFYKAASGANYASLAHRYQPQVDHSNLLELDKAVLIGRADISPTVVQVKATGTGEVSEDLVSEGGTERVWYRLVFPVETRRK